MSEEAKVTEVEEKKVKCERERVTYRRRGYYYCYYWCKL